MAPHRSLGPVLAAVIGTACAASSKPDVTRPPGRDGGGSGGAGGSIDRDAAPRDAADDGVPSDAPPDPLVAVRFGIVPTAPESGVVSAETEALLDVLAAGSRAVTFVRTWDEAMTTGSSPNRSVWDRMAKISPLLRSTGRSVLLTLALTDRVRDARPADLSGAWDSAETLAAAERIIDEGYGAFGSELQYLSIGNDVDRWMSGASASERAAFSALVEHSVDYARAHPNRPAETRIGVTITAGGLTRGDSDVIRLASLGDVIVTTFYLMDDGFAARPPGGIARDLDDLVAALPPGAAARAVVLQEVGYPSDELAGGSEDKQATFYGSFAQALLSRRERFPFVTAFSSDDPDDAGCDRAVAAYGETTPEARAAICTMGVRWNDGGEKSAWATLLDAVATFAQP